MLRRQTKGDMEGFDGHAYVTLPNVIPSVKSERVGGWSGRSSCSHKLQCGRMVALYFTLASVTALYCLLGYWLAFGRLYWLWRATGVCIVLALLVPIRAYEPLVFFGMTSLLFVAVAGCRRLFLGWREEGERHRRQRLPLKSRNQGIGSNFGCMICSDSWR